MKKCVAFLLFFLFLFSLLRFFAFTIHTQSIMLSPHSTLHKHHILYVLLLGVKTNYTSLMYNSIRQLYAPVTNPVLIRDINRQPNISLDTTYFNRATPRSALCACYVIETIKITLTINKISMTQTTQHTLQYSDNFTVTTHFIDELIGDMILCTKSCWINSLEINNLPIAAEVIQH